MRQWLIDFPKESKGGLNTLKYMSQLSPSHFKPQPPALSNYTTGELMGSTSEKISERFGGQDKIWIYLLLDLIN